MKSGGEGSSHAPGHAVVGDGVRLQEANAEGRGPSGDFGIEGFAAANYDGGRHPDRGMSHDAMGDKERGAPPAISMGSRKMGATAHSDHGPHQVRHGDGGQHAGYTGFRGRG